MITILLSKNFRTIKPKIAGKRRRIAFLASLSLSQNLVRYEFVHWRESLRKRACILCHLCADMLYFPRMYSICIAWSCFALRAQIFAPSFPLQSRSLTFLLTDGHHTTARRGCRMGDMHTISDEIHTKSHVHRLLFAFASTTFVKTWARKSIAIPQFSRRLGRCM